MCQHVRSRGAGSSERGDRPAGVGLRIPGSGSSSIWEQLAGPDRWARVRKLGGRRDSRDSRDSRDGCDHLQFVRERRRGGHRIIGDLEDQKEAPADDARKVCQPWRSARREPDELRTPGILPGTPFCGRWRETFRPQETRTPKGLQPRSGGRRSRPHGHRTQQGRLQNRLHTTTWTQGGAQTHHCWEDSFFSRSLATGFQIGVDIHDKT